MAKTMIARDCGHDDAPRSTCEIRTTLHVCQACAFEILAHGRPPLQVLEAARLPMPTLEGWIQVLETVLVPDLARAAATRVFDTLAGRTWAAEDSYRARIAQLVEALTVLEGQITSPHVIRDRDVDPTRPGS